MVSCWENPQCGQVNTDSKIMDVTTYWLPSGDSLAKLTTVTRLSCQPSRFWCTARTENEIYRTSARRCLKWLGGVLQTLPVQVKKIPAGFEHKIVYSSHALK